MAVRDEKGRGGVKKGEVLFKTGGRYLGMEK